MPAPACAALLKLAFKQLTCWITVQITKTHLQLPQNDSSRYSKPHGFWRQGEVSTICLLLSGAGAAASAAVPDFNSYPHATISNSQVQVRFYLPDPEKGYYRGTRFDWSGLISRIDCEGHSFFSEFNQQGHDPLNHDDICGTAEEFGMTVLPPGFAQVTTNGAFVKIGIGILEHGADPEYGFYKKYRIIEPAQWKVTRTKNSARFQHTLKTRDGWGYAYTKTLLLPAGERVLKIERTLKNTGTRTIITDHYGHNFLQIDNAPAGPDYRIEFPFNLRFGEGSKPEGCVVALDKQLAFQKRVPSGSSVWVLLEGFTSADKNSLKILNAQSGSAMTIGTDLPLARLAFYSSRDILCPEPFVKFELAPGEAKTWTTTYSFEFGRR